MQPEGEGREGGRPLPQQEASPWAARVSPSGGQHKTWQEGPRGFDRKRDGTGGALPGACPVPPQTESRPQSPGPWGHSPGWGPCQGAATTSSVAGGWLLRAVLGMADLSPPTPFRLVFLPGEVPPPDPGLTRGCRSPDGGHPRSWSLRDVSRRARPLWAGDGACSPRPLPVLGSSRPALHAEAPLRWVGRPQG